jgi:NTP pyrophosphatase (non-canonical NTP hydrolase)
MVELMNELDVPWDTQPMTLEDYAAQAMDKAIYPDALIYPMLGLSGEVGELSEKLKRFFRDNDYEVSMEDPVVEMPASLRLDMAHELGDVLWYLTAIASDLGYELEEIAGLNLEKLDSRKRRNKIRGNGDYR